MKYTKQLGSVPILLAENDMKTEAALSPAFQEIDCTSSQAWKQSAVCHQ